MSETIRLLKENAPVKVLLIAPTFPDLSWDKEIGAITESVTTAVLTGKVTLRLIRSAVLKEHYDIIHIVAHACAEGVKLGDELLTCEDLAKVARQGRVKILFLNACDTVVCGQHAVDNGVDVAICYRVDVMDDAAWEIAKVFYSTLAQDEEAIESAYQAAKPSDHTLIRLVGDNFMRELLK